MNRLFYKYAGFVVLLNLFGVAAFSQADITGPTCVHPGIEYNYIISAYYSGTANFEYITTAGTFSTGGSSASHTGPGLASVSITWTSSGEVELFSNAGTKSYFVTVTPATAGGTITSGQTQNLAYNTTPATIICSVATGGPCTTPNYQYQWQESPDNVNFSDIIGATSADYAFSAGQTKTTYYRRLVTETVTGETAYSDVASVVLIPPDPIFPVVGGSVTPATQVVNYAATATRLTSVGVSGGTYTYTYQWQSLGASGPPTSWTDIPGAKATVYTPSGLTATTYFRVAVTSDNNTAYSSQSNVVILPKFIAGTITPTTVTILPGGNPGGITGTIPTGGSGTYSLQWQSSTDGVTFFDISGATSLYYLSDTSAANTWYRLQYTSNGVVVYSNLCQVVVSSSVPDLNFVQTRDIYKPGVTDSAAASAMVSPVDFAQTTQFVDGLGRPVQTVAMQQSPLQKDVVSINVYDPFNREAFKYQPYVATTSDGNYKATAIADQYAFNAGQFPGEQYYYGITNYEPSPLNRVNSQMAPGMSWAGSGRGTGLQYLINTLEDSVRLWTIDNAVGSLPVSDDVYPAGTLHKAVSTDEDSHMVVEYKDLGGNVVLKKTALSISSANGHVGWLCTYYVYDISNELRFVIPPRAVEITNTTAGTWVVSQAVADELCFRYEYDYRKRMAIKKVPGAGEAWMVYDARNRLVFTQDSSLRTHLQWLGSLYDGLNRATVTGMMVYSGTRDQLQALVSSQTAAGGNSSITVVGTSSTTQQPSIVLNTGAMSGDFHASQSIGLTAGFGVQEGSSFSATILGGGSGSTSGNAASVNDNPVPSGAVFNPLTVTFYDDYSWVAGTNTALSSSLDATNTSNGNYFITGFAISPIYAVPIMPFTIARGLVTGSMALVLGSSNQYLYQVRFYDDRGRTIQSQDINVTGGKDVVTEQYDFSGKMLRALSQQQKSGSNTQTHTVLSKMSYDPRGRLLTATRTINSVIGEQNISVPEQTIASNQYNELGQLQNKSLGNSIESLAYDYNIRGWLNSVNKNYIAGTSSNYFGMELGYDKSTSVSTTTYASPQFSGNIGGIVWKSAGDGVDRKYDFSYDAVNRLTGADFNQQFGSTWGKSDPGNPSFTMDFSVCNLSYDANGNIQSMKQQGFKVGGSSPIDQLRYGYLNNGASNRLIQVYDTANDPISKLGDFHYTGSKQSSDYSYDGNGNLTLDNNKGISGITYNYLNLPQQVAVTAKGTIAYTYDAAGNKLLKTTTDNTASPSVTTTTLYLGEMVYQNDILQFIGHEEGRTRWAFHQYKDGGSGYGFEHDYFLKDHLGNTRVVLTQEKDTAQYIATMETAYRNTEDALFYNISETAYPVSSIPGGYPSDNTTNPNGFVARVNGSGQTMGPSIILKVMAGDTVDIGVKSYYTSQTGTGTQPSITDVLNSLATGLVNLTGGSHGSLAQLTDPAGGLYGALNSFVQGNNPVVAGQLRSYLNWVLLDNQFNYVSGYPQSGAIPVTNFTTGTLGTPAMSNIRMPKSGYLYIYVSNETKGVDVFFDNLCVRHRSGPLLEETHYYPFGLTMAGISDKALKTNYVENKHRFNFGSELQSKEFSDGSGLELYDAHHRMYDPQLGRFGQVDPLGDATFYYSPYSFGSNNPISHIDPFGLTDTVVTTKTTNLASYTVYGHKPQAWGGFYWPQSTPVEKKTWARNQGLYADRLSQNQPLSQKGDPASYSSSLSMYKRWTQAKKDGDAMELWALGIMAAPALLAASPAEVALALQIKVGTNIGAFAVDAGVQTVVNSIEHKNIFSSYNILSGATAFVIGAPGGAPISNLLGVNFINSTLSTSINISGSSLFDKDKIFSFNPSSILIGTVFGAGAGRASQVMGGGSVGDMLASPFNLSGAGVDEGTKPKE